MYLGYVDNYQKIIKKVNFRISGAVYTLIFFKVLENTIYFSLECALIN